MPKIAVVILNWNQPKLTLTTINSILQIKHTHFEYKIILVTNTKLNIKPDIFQILTKDNLGFTGGNNLGINYALKNNFDYILIANNDIRVDANFLEKLLSEIKLQPKSIVAPKIYFEKGYEFHKNRYQKSDLGNVIWAMGGKIDWNNIYGSNIAIDEVDKGQYDKNPPIPDFISGCCFLASSKFFQQVGHFDEKYYLYMEDVDLSLRAVKAGYTIIIVPNSKIWHINSGTAGAATNIQDYFITRNRLLFAFKYGSLKTKMAIFRESLKHLLFGRPWQKIGIKDYYLSKFGQGSWV